MIDTEKFTSRIQKIIKHHNLSASSFADKIGVQRSGISHILSGRNKPSLDFIMKVLSHFPDVDIYWLLNGKGSFPKTQDEIEHNTPSLSSNKIQGFNSKKEIEKLDDDKKEIERIVIFYKDGTFKNFKN